VTAVAPEPGWNPAPHPFRRAETVHELFDWCVRRWPSAVAVRHDAREVTYAGLAAASVGYAAELEARGVGPGQVVPVLLNRSPEFLAVLLAVLRRGAAYAALDRRWPRARLTALMARLDGAVVITDEDGPWPRPTWAPPPILESVGAGTGGPGSPAAVPVGRDDPSAVFFTSGSTGTPKGVLTAHRGNVRLFDDWAFAPAGSGTVMPQSLAPTWDAFGLDSWSVLLGGGTIIIMPDSLELARRLPELISGQGVNTVFLPTAVFHMVVDSDLDAFTGLRVVGTGGERLSPGHARRFLERHPGIPLHNMYGPVESTIAATDHVVRLADCDEETGVPLGRAFDHTAVHVMDGDRLCAVGEVGEICLSGAGLALGYLDDPELTAQRFTPGPPGPDGEPVRIYRTGDLGHWSAEGLIYFDGRADRQVKIRGFRVELDDVERNARQVAGVGSCAVVPLSGPDGSCEDLTLFYVAAQSDLEAEQLRADLAARLPGYLVPGQIHRLDRLPVLEDRKVDRRALNELAAELRRQGAAGEEPLGPAEEAVASAFGEVLGVRAIPRDTSFFALGGTSLAAAQLCAHLDGRFPNRVELAAVFDQPTVRGLARLLEA
jgi:amino acid adenylation domain-containing protein